MNNLALKEINSAQKPIENHHFVMICKVILIEKHVFVFISTEKSFTSTLGQQHFCAHLIKSISFTKC